jgi:hypothetical protein
MKFKCTINFEHSGVRSYRRDDVYELDKKQAETLTGLDPKIHLGALSFFEPVDDFAKDFVKDFVKDFKAPDSSKKK